MKKRDLTDQVIKELYRFGADLMGIAPFEAMKLYEELMLKSPTFWEIWQNLTTGIFYYCFECLNACPVGKRR